jgi:tetratricopeptide (TPR) repeat protein
MAKQTATAAAVASGPDAWVWNGWVDLTIGCAGWTVPLLAVTYLLSHAAWLDVAFAFSLLALVCNHPHYMATLYRAFSSRESLDTYRFYAVYLSVLCGLTLIAAHLFPPMVPLLFTLYVVWSPWHYSGQNFGLLLLFARRRGVSLTGSERRVLSFAFVASYLAWLLTVQTTPSSDPYVRSLDVPAAVADPIGLFLVCGFAVATVAVFARLATRTGWRVLVPSAVLISSQALWFVAPWLVQVTVGRHVSPLYYTTGALAFMHCAQYLWITAFSARRESGTAAWRPTWYAVVLILGGIALFIPGPWIASTVLGFDFRETTLIFIAVINLHHFVLDGALWKLRDRRVATLLVSSEPAAPALSPALLRWPRPAVGWALAVALMVVAAVSALQQYLTLDGAGPSALDLARRLNPHDTRVDVRTAERLVRGDHPAAALHALARESELRPANAAALRLYGTLLVATGQLSEAAAHYRAVEQSVGLDAPGLVNVAVLSIRDGQLDAAAEALHAALHLDPQLSAAHLNLAGLCLQRRDAECALRHYVAYLASPDVARDRAYAAAALNAASAAALAERPQDALELLGVSTTIAERLGASDLVALAGRQASALGAERVSDATRAQ